MSSQSPTRPAAAEAEAVRAELEPRAVDTKTTALALVSAWLLPGLGHVVLGRIRRGVVFGILVLGSFGLGLAHDGRLALKNDRETFLSALQVLANVGVGPVDTLARIRVYGAPSYALPRDPADPSRESRLAVFRERARSERAAYGTAYLWTAGLMNLLLLMDVWDISKGRKA